MVVVVVVAAAAISLVVVAAEAQSRPVKVQMALQALFVKVVVSRWRGTVPIPPPKGRHQPLG